MQSTEPSSCWKDLPVGYQFCMHFWCNIAWHFQSGNILDQAYPFSAQIPHSALHVSRLAGVNRNVPRLARSSDEVRVHPELRTHGEPHDIGRRASSGKQGNSCQERIMMTHCMYFKVTYTHSAYGQGRMRSFWWQVTLRAREEKVQYPDKSQANTVKHGLCLPGSQLKCCLKSTVKNPLAVEKIQFLMHNTGAKKVV